MPVTYFGPSVLLAVPRRDRLPAPPRRRRERRRRARHDAATRAGGLPPSRAYRGPPATRVVVAGLATAARLASARRVPSPSHAFGRSLRSSRATPSVGKYPVTERAAARPPPRPRSPHPSPASAVAPFFCARSPARRGPCLPARVQYVDPRCHWTRASSSHTRALASEVPDAGRVPRGQARYSYSLHRVLVVA